MVSPKERVGIHMRKNHWITRLVILMLASYALLVVSVTAAGSAGSEGDPLVTLSYLNAGQSLYFLRNELKDLGFMRQRFEFMNLYGRE